MLQTESHIIGVCAFKQRVAKSRTSSAAGRVWNRRSAVWRGHLSAGVLEPRVYLRVAGPPACLCSGHLPKAWRSAVSRAGRSDCCTQSRPSAKCPEIGCCLNGWASLLLLHHCLHVALSSPWLVPAACVLSPPQKSAARSDSCHGEARVSVALPPGHEIQVCQEYRVSCSSLLNWRTKREKEDKCYFTKGKTLGRGGLTIYIQNHALLRTPVECGSPATCCWYGCPWQSLLPHKHWIWVCSDSWSA